MKPNNKNIFKSILWGVIQLALFIALYQLFISYVKEARDIREKTITYTISPEKDDIGFTPPDREIAAKAHPEEVKTGTYLERIINFDIVQSRWQYEFYQWFTWDPKKVNFMPVAELEKGATKPENLPFKIINGDIEHAETIDFNVDSSKKIAYVLYLLKATNTQFFDASTFPMDKHLLEIPIEHVKADINQIKFIPDTAGSNVSSRVAINSYILGKHYATYKLHTYKSALGDPRIIGGNHKTFSQYRFCVIVKRNGYIYYTKMFVTLIVAILIAFLSFFAADNEKVRIITSSLFTAAASYYILGAKIPSSSTITIAELVNIISLITIFIITCQETILKFWIKKNPFLTLITNWLTFIYTLIFYLAINFEIPYILNV